MKTLSLVLILAALPLCANAESPPPSIAIDCAQPTLPSQQAVARLTGIDNFGQAYAARSRLLVNAQRSCKQSQAAMVVLVLQPVAPPADRRIALQAPR